ncbi:LysR family transcriptional regulator [Microbacterium sp. NPDC077184]|uniref:LysR family transcriptional regulator n=1 Tax=Microbacterium sp. NPDC077184 TaxID=3154764 RepID=UPI003426D083
MVVPFTLRQLEYFAATAELGSFRAAAAECRVSETALAQSVTDLEKTLGQTLLIRQRSRGVTPTSEGRALLVLSRSLLDHATEVSVAADEMRSELSGPLRIGCYSTLSPFIVPSILADFATPHPRLEVTIVEGDPNDLQNQLVDGKLDCVLLQRRQAMPGVITRSLRTGEPKLLLSAEHPRAASRVVALHDLADEPMVLLDLPGVRANLLPMLAEVGIEPRIGWRTTVFETVRSLVARNLGWAVLIHRPPVEVSYEKLPLVAVKIAEPIASSDVSLGVLRGRRLNARLLAFEKHCVEHFRRLDAAAQD